MNVTGGTTDVSTYFVLRTAATGVALTGATITNIDLQYTRTGTAPVAKVDATALAATDSAHADNKAIEIDATDQPGLYRVDWPDAAFAAGARQVILTVLYATAFVEHMAVEIDPPVGVAASVTGAVGSVTGAVGSVTGACGSVTGAVGSVTGACGSVTGAVGSVAGNVDGSVASVVGAVGSVTGAVGSVTGAVGSVTGNVGGNVTGSVGSVAGAVGSVTGNVGGNVTGSVGSLVGHTVQTGDSYARVGAPVGASISADLAAVKAETVLIVADTNELQTDWADGGRLDLLLDAVGDPLATAVPGAYGAGTAGGVIGAWKDGERLDLILDALAPGAATNVTIEHNPVSLSEN